MLQTKTHFSRYIIYVYIYIKYTLYISSRCLKFTRPISPSTWWWTWWPSAAPCPSWPLAAWPSPVRPWPNCWGWRYRAKRRKNCEFSGKNGDFAGKIWTFSWKMDEIWDFSQQTMVIWHDVCQWKMGFDPWNRDFAMKHGEDLRICPGMERTTSQCHYVCRFPALWWEDIGSVDNTSTHLLPTGKVT